MGEPPVGIAPPLLPTPQVLRPRAVRAVGDVQFKQIALRHVEGDGRPQDWRAAALPTIGIWGPAVARFVQSRPDPETRDDALRREIEARTRPTEQPRGR